MTLDANADFKIYGFDRLQELACQRGLPDRESKARPELVTALRDISIGLSWDCKSCSFAQEEGTMNSLLEVAKRPSLEVASLSCMKADIADFRPKWLRFGGINQS